MSPLPDDQMVVDPADLVGLADTTLTASGQVVDGVTPIRSRERLPGSAFGTTSHAAGLSLEVNAYLEAALEVGDTLSDTLDQDADSLIMAAAFYVDRDHQSALTIGTSASGNRIGRDF